MIERVAWDVDAAALEDTLLAVKWEVVGVFTNDEVGDEVEAGKPSKEWSCRRRGEDGCLVGIVFTADFDTLDDLANTASGLVVEKFGDFVPDDFVVLRMSFVFGWEFDAFFNG